MTHSRAKVSMIGRKFGYLFVIAECPNRNIRGHILYECECYCGARKNILGASLRSGRTTSCGCVHKNAISKHGLDGTPTYRAWVGMKSRCLSQSNPIYERYGGRGISVCERWMVFENFLKDMGIRPDGLSIDRIDVNGNYEPSNCRWADAKTQANNRRNNIKVVVEGRMLTVSDFSKINGISEKAARRRIHREYKRGLDGVFVKDS